MAKQTINIGTTANDGTGDPLRTAFDKVNSNFTELYNDDAGDVNSIIAGDGISVDTATGNVTVTNTITNNNQLTNGAGYVDGSGTANYIPKWTDGDTIGNSVIYDDGTNVGIGTDSPLAKTHIKSGNSGFTGTLNTNYDDLAIEGSGNSGITILTPNNNNGGIAFSDENAEFQGLIVYGHSDNFMAFRTLGSEGMRIDSSGNVGIGTSNPTNYLTLGFGGTASVPAIAIGQDTDTGWFRPADNSIGFTTGGTERMRILPSGGITFNGDTSASNALDDYEEGTWTMGISFGGGSTGITYTTRTGRYTKVGNMVTVVGYVMMSNKGTSFAAARITGLPFTIGSGDTNYSAPSLRLNKISFANQYTGFGEPNNTTILLVEQTEAGVETALNDTNFVNNSEIILTYTYFV